MATSNDTVILKSFLDSREDYDKYAPYIIALQNMERLTRTFLGLITDYYNKYPDSTNITELEFKLFAKQNDPHAFVKNNSTLINDTFNLEITNVGLKMDIIEAACERHFMAKVIDKASLVLNNNQSGVLTDVQDIIDEYHGLIRTPPNDIAEYVLDLDELIKTEITKDGIPFVNPTPNTLIKGMRPGQLGLIYAYTDTGKTSYGVANLCSAAKHLYDTQSDRLAIYAANEEAVSRVTLRAIQCMTNWNDAEIEKYASSVRSIINKRGFTHMKFIDHVTNMTIVKKILTKHNPRVMFIDQGTKVNIQRSRNEGVNALEEVFNEYRDLAKRHECTIICMAQGGDDCYEKKYPNLRDLYGSKSAIQGELDWAISLGVETDTKYANWRYFNITKNKGDKGTYACRFKSDRCQFKEAII